MKGTAIIVAAGATIWAALAYVQLAANFLLAFLVALIGLGVVFAIDYRRSERERMTHGREQVWERRDLGAWDDEMLREVD